MPSKHHADQTPDLPLSGFQVLHTDDFDRARDEVGRVFREHRAVLIGPDDDLDVRIHDCPLPRTRLVYVAYGAPTELRVPPNDDFYALHFPLAGQHRITYGNETVELSASHASTASATRPIRFAFAGGFRTLSLKLDRSALEQQLEALTGVGVHRPIEFEIGVDVSRGAGASLFRLIRFLSEEFDRDASLIEELIVLSKFEDAVLTAVLTGLSHNYAARFRERTAEAAPRHVRAVEAYIKATADEPISIGALADIAGVSAKSLFAAFRRHRGYSPMSYVKSCRLTRARAALTTAGPGTNVTRVALDCGFTCLGRFSVAYKQKFGESPSETLRRHR